MASRKKAASASDVESNDNAFREKTKSVPTGPKELGISTAKKDTAVKTKTTIQDNKPKDTTPAKVRMTSANVQSGKIDAPYKNMSELAAYAKNNDVVLGHFGGGLAPTQASFAGAKKLGFEFADDSAFDMLDCNTLSAGDADVINTTLALIEPCLGEINVLASIGEEPISKLNGVETLATQTGINNLELWNGLFVKKGTPQAIIDKLAEIASATMAGAEAQQLMKETGARVYWQDQSASEARIVVDRKKLAELNAINAE
jgi:tripartite-type tricarboxylate transporter receptor subunit TctC